MTQPPAPRSPLRARSAGDEPLQRRRLFKAAAASVVAGAGTVLVASSTRSLAQAPTAARVLPMLRAERLKPGDTIGLVSPSAAIYERDRFAIAQENLTALGFKVKEGVSARARHGHFAGTDAQRAADINAMFADPQVQGIVAMGGGSGATRILHLLDYPLIQRNPKVLCGYSDITALLGAVNAKTGLVCFHGQMAASDWNAFSLDHFMRLLVGGETMQFGRTRTVIVGFRACRAYRIDPTIDGPQHRETSSDPRQRPEPA